MGIGRALRITSSMHTTGSARMLTLLVVTACKWSSWVQQNASTMTDNCCVVLLLLRQLLLLQQN
jgi:hypothetical protein